MSGKDFVVKFSGYISVFVLSAVFILASVVTISESGRTVEQIVIEGALGFMFGIGVDSILGIQGLNNGKRSEAFLKTKRLHGEMVNGISERIHELDPWCEKENAKALKIQRTRILASEGIRYSDCFNEAGEGIGYSSAYEPKSKKELRAMSHDGRAAEKLKVQAETAKRKAYRKALHLKLTPLSTAALTGDCASPDDPYYFGESEKEYERRSVTTDAIKKIATAGIFGYYCVDQVMNFSPAALIWRCLQVCIYIAGGVMKMLSAQSFIVNDKRGQIVKQIDYLQMFKNSKTEVKEDGGHISDE